MGSATKGALIVHRSVVPFHNQGSPTDHFKCLIVKYDLDFDLVTLQGHWGCWSLGLLTFSILIYDFNMVRIGGH